MINKIIVISILALMTAACDNEVATTEVDVNHVSVADEKSTVVKDVNISQDRADIIPEKMTVQEKKERFRQLIVPAVKKVFSELDQQYKQAKSFIKSGNNSEQIAKLKVDYKAESNEDLLLRLKPHPVSIVLAQAAMESAWATSRFFREAKNIFGVWSYDKNEPRIAAGKMRGKKTIWLKKYVTIEAAIRDNYRVLARGAAFSKFRKLRMRSNDPFKLVKGLDKYSELGAKYGKELASVIRYNKFHQYDL